MMHWIALAITFAIVYYLGILPPSSKKFKYDKNDPAINKPYVTQEFDDKKIMFIALIIVPSFLAMSEFMTHGNISSTLKLYVAGFVLQSLICVITKFFIPKPRPNFIQLNMAVGDSKNLKDRKHVQWSKTSFYSGHASTMSYVGLFVALFMLSKFEHSLTMLLFSAMVFLLGLYPGYTQYRDYWHHLSDILFGYFVGIASTLCLNYAFGIFYAGIQHISHDIRHNQNVNLFYDMIALKNLKNIFFKMLDWICLAVMFLLLLKLAFSPPTYDLPYDPNNPAINKPYLPMTISAKLLIIICFIYVPLSIAILKYITYGDIAFIVKKYYFGQISQSIIASVVKIFIGSHRPNFIKMKEALGHSLNPADQTKIKFSKTSFFSLHSSCGCYASAYVALLILSKFQSYDIITGLVCSMIYLSGFYPGLSQYQTYWHHMIDCVVGWTFGTLLAIMTFFVL